MERAASVNFTMVIDAAEDGGRGGEPTGGGGGGNAKTLIALSCLLEWGNLGLYSPVPVYSV